MCVIIASNTKKCPVDWLEKARKKNGDGQGIAWLEDGKVRFFKSHKNFDKIREIYDRIEPPYVLHFRITTQGGSGDKMCHPFPLNHNASLETQGEAKAVLFHNGSNNTWKAECKAAVLRHKLEWPNGPWSDSRAFAWLCYWFGQNFADLLDEKIAILSKDGVKIYGDNWKQEDGIDISNDYFLDKPIVTYGYDHRKWDGCGYGATQMGFGAEEGAGDGKCTNPHCVNGWIVSGADSQVWRSCKVCNDVMD